MPLTLSQPLHYNSLVTETAQTRQISGEVTVMGKTNQLDTRVGMMTIYRNYPGPGMEFRHLSPAMLQLDGPLEIDKTKQEELLGWPDSHMHPTFDPAYPDDGPSLWVGCNQTH